jgi:hypothetical protein
VVDCRGDEAAVAAHLAGHHNGSNAGWLQGAGGGLLESLAVWGAVQTGLSRGLNIGVLSHPALQARGIDVDGPVQALEAKLRELRQAIVDQDFTTLSDCLMYEFPAVAQRVAALLRSLAREADASAAAAKRAKP